MNDSNAWAERVLELSREADEPSRADRARVRSLLVARCLLEPGLAAAAVHTGASGATGSSKAALGSKALLSKALVAFGIGGAAGAVTSAAVVAFAPEPAPHPAPAISSSAPQTPRPTPRALAPHAAPLASAPVAPAPAAEKAAASPGERHGSAAAAVAQASTPTPEPTPAPSNLSVELDALRRAQQLLHRGEASSALGVLGELDRVVPAGVLGEERAATRALAACAARGRDRARVTEFLGRYPGSVHVERVKAACEPTAVAPENQNTDPPASRH